MLTIHPPRTGPPVEPGHVIDLVHWWTKLPLHRAAFLRVVRVEPGGDGWTLTLTDGARTADVTIPTQDVRRRLQRSSVQIGLDTRASRAESDLPARVYLWRPSWGTVGHADRDGAGWTVNLLEGPALTAPAPSLMVALERLGLDVVG